MEILRTQTIQSTTQTKSGDRSQATTAESRSAVSGAGNTVPATDAPEKQAEASRERLEAATNQINESLAMSQRSVRLGIHEGSGTPVISVIDVETDEVIRQLPSERVLRLASWRAENGLSNTPLEPNLLLDESA